jgi:transcriptional regulator with XRE-family HTH domain
MSNALRMPKNPEWCKSLSEQMKSGAELMAKGTMTQKQIAAQMGISENTITNWKHNPIWIQYVNYLANMNVMESALRLKSLSTEAVNTLGNLLSSENDFIKMRAVEQILNRVGIKDLISMESAQKEEKKTDIESVRNRFNQILESEKADQNIIDITDFTAFTVAPNNSNQIPRDNPSENEAEVVVDEGDNDE